MRRDEEFVIRAVCEAAGARNWSEGENPPDAYLHLGGKRIAVEISTLAQQVVSARGDLVPRQSQDEPAMRMVDRLDSEMRDMFKGERSILLTLFPPFENRRRLEARLRAEITAAVALPEAPMEPIDLKEALIHVFDERQSWQKRIAAALLNKHSSVDILANAKIALEDRLRSKQAWSRVKDSSSSESWLALLNVYGILASPDTYRQALERITIAHGFDRILVVSTSASVETIYQRA